MTETPFEPPADTLPPPLPAGLGVPDHEATPDRRRHAPPVLPISPRAPGAPAQQQSPAGPSATNQAPPANAQHPGTNPAPGPSETPAALTPVTPSPGPDDHAATPDAPENPGPDSAHDAADIDSADETTDADDGDAAADPAIDGSKLPFNPADAAGMASGLAEPLLGLPSALMGLGTGLGAGLLAPFAQILGMFGQGNPAMPDSGGFPPDVLNRLSGIDPATGITGTAADAYGSDLDGQTNQAEAMDNLERKLRTALQDSSANTTLGRDKIEQIISQVQSAIQALGPIANTPAGQMGVMSAIASGIKQAGAVLADASTKDTLTADTIKSMSTDYINDLNAGSADDPSHPAKGIPKDWAVKALAANGITDPKAVANWLPGLMTMGQRESGHNPRAINRTDSNAAKGTPSMGWMQTIKPTFEEHWRPGTSRDIFNPVSNAAAAIHYVMSRYGVSPSGVDLMAKVQQANPYAPPKGY